MKTIFFASLFAFCSLANAQIVNMSNGTTTTCAADFYDSGGPGTNYGNNENFSHTFFPATPGNFISIEFASYQTGMLDQIAIYDGPDNNYTLLFMGGGTLSLPVFVSSDVSGALTVEFSSNGSGNQAGWVASVTCCSAPEYWFPDGDGDGYGDMNFPTYACTQPSGYVLNSDDCDDSQAHYEDWDGDGFGNPLITTACGTPDNTDCDDAEWTFEDSDGDTYGNPNVPTACGVTDFTDCDDTDGGVGSGIMNAYYEDLDGDGFGAGWSLPFFSCTQPVGYVDNSADCADWEITYEDLDGDGFGNPLIQVGCGVPDNTDCDDAISTYADIDGDNFGDPNVLVPCGVVDNTDCDDNDAGIGGGILLTFYSDLDGDGFGDPWNSTLSCTPPIGYVTNSDDCDDFAVMYQDIDGDNFGNPAVQVGCGSYDNSDCDDLVITYADNDGDNFGDPNVMEPCGIVDNTDCDDNDAGVGSGTPIAYYEDIDGDGFGNPWSYLFSCSVPVGYVTDSSDCDDFSIMYQDNDGDGFGDTIVQVACGSYDNSDCDDALLTYEDNDGDTYGDPNILVACGVADNTDCDDGDAGVGGGTLILYFADWDSDGYGDPFQPYYSCTPIFGYVTDSTDCNDFDVFVNPGETEIPGNFIDDNCDGYIDPVVGITESETTTVFTIYPNPTNGLFFIKAVGISDESFSVRIFDFNGKEIQVALSSISNDETIEIDLSDFAKGIYFVNVASTNQNNNYKLIVN